MAIGAAPPPLDMPQLDKHEYEPLSPTLFTSLCGALHKDDDQVVLVALTTLAELSRSSDGRAMALNAGALPLARELETKAPTSPVRSLASQLASRLSAGSPRLSARSGASRGSAGCNAGATSYGSASPSSLSRNSSERGGSPDVTARPKAPPMATIPGVSSASRLPPAGAAPARAAPDPLRVTRSEANLCMGAGRQMPASWLGGSYGPPRFELPQRGASYTAGRPATASGAAVIKTPVNGGPNVWERPAVRRPISALPTWEASSGSFGSAADVANFSFPLPAKLASAASNSKGNNPAEKAAGAGGRAAPAKALPAVVEKRTPPNNGLARAAAAVQVTVAAEAGATSPYSSVLWRMQKAAIAAKPRPLGYISRVVKQSLDETRLPSAPAGRRLSLVERQALYAPKLAPESSTEFNLRIQARRDHWNPRREGFFAASPPPLPGSASKRLAAVPSTLRAYISPSNY